MPKIEHPEFGLVNERSFPAAALDSGLRDSLEEFKGRGLICGYHIEDAMLTLSRPWVEGQTQEEFFRGLSSADRSNYSQLLFRRVQRKLEEMGHGHGALHSRNIISRQGGGFEVVDAVFNRVRMGPPTVPQDDPWMWGPCVPKGWSLQDWDRVSLLRTAALLALGPSAWKPLPVQEVVEMCHRWAAEFIETAPSGADFIAPVRNAVNLLPELEIALSPEKRSPAEGETGGAPQSLETVGNSIAPPFIAPESIPELSKGPIPKAEMHRADGGSKNMSPSIISRVKTAIAENRLAWQVCTWVIGTALAVMAIVVSTNSSVFEDPREWRSWLWGPDGVEQINLSELMSDHHKDREVVYVFALDVSGSLYETRVTEGERERFVQKISADKLGDKYDRDDLKKRCGLVEPELKQWHLARAQICYYLHSIEDGAYVGLWKFGAAPTPISSSRAEQLEMHRRSTEEGVRKRLVEKLMSTEMAPVKGSIDYKRTDFETLFGDLSREYLRDGGYRQKDIRLVIVSDFLHDAGASDPEFYSLSEDRIKGGLEVFKNSRNVTIHLMIVGANEKAANYIVPTIQNGVRWNQYVVDFLGRKPASPMPDFLYGFVAAERRIVFRHSAESDKVHPIHLMWDKGIAESDDSQLIVGLRTAPHRSSNDDLYIYASLGRSDELCPPFEDDNPRSVELKRTVLMPGDRHDFMMERRGDWICLEPLSVERERIYRYQMTLSCESDRAGQRVHVVDVRFQKYMPESAAWVIVVCFALLLLVPLVCTTMTLVSMIRRRAPDRLSFSEDGGPT